MNGKLVLAKSDKKFQALLLDDTLAVREIYGGDNLLYLVLAEGPIELRDDDEYVLNIPTFGEPVIINDGENIRVLNAELTVDALATFPLFGAGRVNYYYQQDEPPMIWKGFKAISDALERVGQHSIFIVHESKNYQGEAEWWVFRDLRALAYSVEQLGKSELLYNYFFDYRGNCYKRVSVEQIVRTDRGAELKVVEGAKLVGKEELLTLI